MSSKRKTPRDRILIVATLLPLLSLLVIYSLAAAKWQTTQPRIRSVLVDALGEEIATAPSPVAADYERQVSSQHTAEYRELLAALDIINDQYAGISSLVEDDAEYLQLDEDRPFTPFLKSYLDEVRPILKQLRELGDLNKIWLPNEFDNPNSYRSGLALSAGLSEVLRLEFIAAVRERDAEQALNAIQLAEHLNAGITLTVQAQPIFVQSVALGFWNEPQLDELERILGKSVDLQQRWMQASTGSFLEKARWLLHGEETEYWRPPTTPTTYAPSTRLHWIERAKQFESVPGIGSMRGVRETVRLGDELLQDAHSEIDTAIQFPLYAQSKSNRNYSYLAKQYARLANSQRWRRTAIAIAKYKLQTGDYPESLNDLADIGFDLSLTLDPLDRAFHYANDSKTVALGNASRSFATQLGSWTSFQTDEHALSSVLQQYQEVEFQKEIDNDDNEASSTD